jgi:hypothetical protein
MPDGFCNKADNKKYPTFQGWGDNTSELGDGKRQT